MPSLIHYARATLAAAGLSSIAAGVHANAAAPVASMPGLLRSLEEANGDGDGSFVSAYSVKFEGCVESAQWNGDNDGGDGAKIVMKRVALLRLCPSDSCQDDASDGCSEGYGEYAVDLGTFVEAWLGEGEGGDGGGFDPAEYAQCAAYGDDGYSYVGPSCSEDGSKVGFGVFADETCSTPSSSSFYETTGYALPYSDGTSLIPESCLNCLDGDGEASEMCQEVYQRSGKCETKMGVDYPNENACDYIAQLRSEMSSTASSSTGLSKGFVAFLVISGILVVLLGVYVLYLKKKLGRASVSLNEGEAAARPMA